MADVKDDDKTDDKTPDAAVDDTADKAAAIGDAIGASKEEIPDYDIKEAADDRIAKTRDDADAGIRQKGDRKELTNKEKRELRKKRMREKFNEKDAIIAEQQAQLNAVNGRLAQVEGRLAGVDKGQVKTALADTIRIFNAAQERYKESFKEGDAEKSLAAVKELDIAQKRIEQLQNLEQQLERPRQQQTQQPAFDAATVNHAKKWAERNTWFQQDAGGNALDEDSEIAMALSARLVKEGYDPKSQDFWDELDERAQKRLPHVAEAIQNDEDDDDEPRAQQPRKRSAPPVTGGANRGDVRGKVSITLPTEFINTLKDNGIWDDTEKRNRVIKRYLDGKRQEGAA
jgi:hypothetical protein